MRFGILGPVEIWDGGHPVAVGGPQQRAVLALLLVHAGRVVSTARLTDQLWGERPPPTARNLLQGCVAELRRTLRRTGGAVLATRPPGYLLEVEPGELDLDRFEDLVSTAGAYSARDSAAALDRAGALLAEALALWRGPALDGVAVEACQAEAARLEERRLAVLAERVDVDLRLGRHASLIPELRTLVADDPLHEGLWSRLMLALHGAGRDADALTAYQEARSALVDQLGVEPGMALRDLHQALLTGAEVDGGYRPRPRRLEPVPSQPAAEPARLPATRSTPAQLPAPTAVFAGRDADLGWLDARLADRGGPAVAVLSGTAGIGKTALALRWAHRVRERFPDGQLHANLRGYADAPPSAPLSVLTGFLRALGVAADEIPTDLEMAAALYRTLMAGRRALVVLDNARAADQVRPLLPGDPGCLVLVTSRDRLGGLVAHEGAAHRTLGVLTTGEARDLLARVLGRDRVEAEPEAAAALAAGCAYLPLALRIAAAQLALRPGRTIAGQAAELGTDGRLDALAVDGEDDERGAVRAAFDLSYQALPRPARRLFRALAAVPGPDFTAPVAAALLDTAPSEAAALLDRLAGAHLIDPQAGEERYSLHDLLRFYAAELAGAEDSAEVRATTSDRLYAHYLSTAGVAADLLYPHMLRLPADPAAAPPATAPFADHAAALGWLDAERPNLVAAVRDQTGPAARSGCRLADLLRGYFHLRRHLSDWLAVGEAALAAAQEAGDRHAECAARHSLGTAYRCLGDNTAALRNYAAGLRLARACGWAESEATALGNLGIMSLKIGRLKAAVRQLEKALALDRRNGSLAGQANNLRHLAVAEHQRGELAAAAAHFAESERLNRLTDCQHGQALALTGLGEVSHERGRFADAERQLTAALDLYVLVGDRDGQSVAYHCLAALDGDAGRPERALAHALASITLAREIGDRRAEAAALNTLARAHHHTHRYTEALDCHRRAHDLAVETGTRRVAIGALLGMSATHRHLGDMSGAAAGALRALALARSGGYRTLENQARAALETSQLPFTDWIWSTSYG